MNVLTINTLVLIFRGRKPLSVPKNPTHYAHDVLFRHQSPISGVVTITDIVACHEVVVMLPSVAVNGLTISIDDAMRQVPGDFCTQFPLQESVVELTLTRGDWSYFPFARQVVGTELL